MPQEAGGRRTSPAETWPDQRRGERNNTHQQARGDSQLRWFMQLEGKPSTTGWVSGASEWLVLGASRHFGVRTDGRSPLALIEGIQKSKTNLLTGRRFCIIYLAIDILFSRRPGSALRSIHLPQVATSQILLAARTRTKDDESHSSRLVSPPQGSDSRSGGRAPVFRHLALVCLRNALT